MKKQFKKGLSVFCAALMVLGGIQVAGKEAKAEGDTVAYLSFADSAWGDAQYWNDGNDYAVKAKTADVTGDGTYTVSLDFSGTEAGKAADIAFLDVEIANGEAAYPDSFMTIDSVKINGKEVEVGATYTSSDDDIATRTNLYNEWVSSVDKGRTADGKSDDVTATPIDGKSFTDIETIEVTFTLGSGVAFGETKAEGTAAKELPSEGTTAYLSFADNAWAVQYWFDGKDYSPVEATNATVTGYGEYTVSLDFSKTEAGSAPDMVFMDVEVAGGEEYFPNCYMDIKSVKINGEAVDLGTTYTSSDDGIATRTNLFNTWVTEVTEGRAGDADLAEATATPVDGTKYTDIKTVEVTFELKEGEAATVEKDYSNGFNAFLMFADGSKAWENYEAGVGTECTVLGDGVYEVSLSAEQCGATGKAAPDESALVFLVDIEGLGQAMIDSGTLDMNDDEKYIVTDAVAKVAVFVDGEEVTSKSSNIVLGDIEQNGRLRIDLFNAYDNAGTAEKPVVSPALLTPEKEIKVVFSLSGTGFNSDADTDIDAYLGKGGEEEAAPTVAEKDGLSTGAIIAIVVAVVAVIAAVVVVVVLKKKKDGSKEE